LRRLARRPGADPNRLQVGANRYSQWSPIPAIGKLGPSRERWPSGVGCVPGRPTRVAQDWSCFTHSSAVARCEQGARPVGLDAVKTTEESVNHSTATRRVRFFGDETFRLQHGKSVLCVLAVSAFLAAAVAPALAESLKWEPGYHLTKTDVAEVGAASDRYVAWPLNRHIGRLRSEDPHGRSGSFRDRRQSNRSWPDLKVAGGPRPVMAPPAFKGSAMGRAFPVDDKDGGPPPA